MAENCSHGVDKELQLLLGIQSTSAIKTIFTQKCANAIALIDRSTFMDFDAIAKEERNTVFTKAFFGGGTDWNNLYPIDLPGVQETFDNVAHSAGISWPGDNEGINRNFKGCWMDTVMCCYTRDVVHDNSDACYVDMDKAPSGPHTRGFAVYNGNEGNMHCHGYTWEHGNSMSELYKANSLFYVSMYDQLSQKGHTESLPGAHMCGCLERMPVVTRADCTQMVIIQQATFKIGFGMVSVKISDEVAINYEECEGGDGNDLRSHFEHLVSEGKQSKSRFNAIKDRLVGEGNCPAATAKFLAEKKNWVPKVSATA